MRFIKALVLSSIPVVIGPNVPTPDIPTIEFEAFFNISTVAGAFTGNENPSLSQQLVGITKRKARLDINYYRTSGNVYYGSFTQECSSTANTFNLQIKDQITISPIKLDIDVNYVDNGESLFSDEAIIELPHHGKYIANGNEITIPNVCFGVEFGSLINSEKYDFTDTNEYITIDDYSRIDISSMMFGYYPSSNYRFTEAFLEIVDYENVYPNLAKYDGDKTIRIPLKRNTKLTDIQFSLNKQMYVNQSTLDMSDNQLDGYTETTSLYLPFGKQDKMSNNEVKIFIYESGFDLADIVIPLRFTGDRNYFGFCSDSDYCIHGGIRK